MADVMKVSQEPCRDDNAWVQEALPRILDSCDPIATNHPANDNSQTRVSTGPIAQG
jgi:hypothetical protein